MSNSSQNGRNNQGSKVFRLEQGASKSSPNGPVFSSAGAYTPGYATSGNLALQLSLMNFLDEFTDVVTGELRLYQKDQGNQFNQLA